MTKIKLLDDLTIQKISAGEVVERPASIVKELVENSLDAGADDIIVEIKEGGKSYIRVSDNGLGIAEDEIDLAFKRHSTSKLSSIEDLMEIRSLGFRGEALSSISNVSKVEIMTKTEDSRAATRAYIEEGKVLSKEPIGSPRGTTIIVRDLFYNVPVRREFLKTDLTESNRVSDVVYKAALGSPDRNFRFIKDGKLILTSSKDNNLKNHIYTILGADFAKNLLAIEAETDYFKLKGFISNNHLYRGNRSHQYLYVNGRYVENLNLSKSIEEEYRNSIPSNRFPVFILFIDIDPADIDVNIHPTKQEIKFAKEDLIIDSIARIITQRLREEFTIPSMKPKRKKAEKKNDEIPLLFNMMDEKIDRIDNSKLEEDNKLNNQINNDKDQSVFIAEEDRSPSFSSRDQESREKEAPDHKRSPREEAFYNTIDNLIPVGILFNTYIIAEDRVNRIFYFIDQHAAHERVMYEKYLNDFRNESVHSQQLIGGQIIDLTASEMSKVMDNKELFQALGFDLEAFGSNSIIIRAVPILFGSPDIKDLFFEILDNLDSGLSSSYDLRAEKIMKIACVNSIKSGDKLKEEEILSLFDQLKETEHPYSCPHGRPTIIKMSEKDIEKEFLRIV